MKFDERSFYTVNAVVDEQLRNGQKLYRCLTKALWQVVSPLKGLLLDVALLKYGKTRVSGRSS